MNKKEFKYTIDEFADIRILRYKVDNFDNLTLNEKLYIYYLSEAAKAGRDIFWMQKSKNGLLVRRMIEDILNTYKGDKTCDNYTKFIDYAKRVFFSNGLHHHYNKTKIFPEVSRTYFLNLLKESKIKTNKESFENYTKRLLDIIYDANKPTGDLIAVSVANFYEDVSEKEAKAYYEALESSDDKEPVSYGLNSKLIKKDNELFEDVYQASGLYGKAIQEIIKWLKKAIEVTENDNQKRYTQLLIEYYETGDLKLWDEYNIAWASSDDGLIDYINGFIEVYEDPIAFKGTWEAMVNIKNIEETKITEIIAENAQWFEDNSPTDSKYKKKKVKGITAKVIDTITLGGDCYPSSPIGINLPNSNWIREEYGSKSVSIYNITNAYDEAALEVKSNVRGEFSYDKSNLEEKRKQIIISGNVHTHLHECIGHASGIILPKVATSALKECHSTLEEARADLFALYYLADPKLVELGIIDSLDIAKAHYEAYVKSGLQVQLVRIELGNDVIESHMQAHKLISHWAYELGFKDNVIEKKIKDSKTYFVVNDYLKLRDIFAEILKEVQRIKSEGDYIAGKRLIDKYAVKVDYKLHEEVLIRYKKLNLKPYSGFVNPDLKIIKKDNKINDVKIIYPKDFIKQQLDYGKKYSYL